MQAINLPITLDESIAVPLYEQLSQSLKDAIKSGRIPPGTVFESTRTLSKKLGVSRHTVRHSIEILQSQGYLEAKNGRLITVSLQDNITLSDSETIRSNNVAPPISTFGRHVVAIGSGADKLSEEVFRQPFQIPINKWKQLMQKQMRNQLHLLTSVNSDPLGLSLLRRELKDYLGRSRSVVCDPEQIIVFPDFIAALDSMLRLTVEFNESVAVENPTSQNVLALFKGHDLNMIPLDVDEEGVCVEQLDVLEHKPRFVHVTPSHNNPLGTPMSVKRRKELLSWACQNDAFILENDEENLYRYSTRPLPSIQGLDPSNSRVIYFSSFRSSLYPLLQLAFVVVPKSLVSLMSFARQQLHQNISIIEQLVLTELLKDGFLERHIRKSNQTLSFRRRSLMIALTKAFQKNIWIARESAGTNLLVRINAPKSESEFIEAANLSGLKMAGTNTLYIEQNAPDGQIMISFASINPSEIDFQVAEFAERLNMNREQVYMNRVPGYVMDLI